jgi:hypothetical protein
MYTRVCVCVCVEIVWQCVSIRGYVCEFVYVCVSVLRVYGVYEGADSFCMIKFSVFLVEDGDQVGGSWSHFSEVH